MKTIVAHLASALTIVTAVSGCGGGGGGSNDTPAGVDDPITVRGTAAVGRPLAGATVVVKDRNGRTTTTTTDANGAYAVTYANSATPRWPLVARVSGGTLDCGPRSACTPSANAQSYVGVSVVATGAGGSSTLNLTPMSHAVASAATHREASALFDAPDLLDPVNPLDLLDATFTVLDWLLRLDPTILLPRDIDFVGGAFVPVPGDSQDAFLDLMAAILAAVFIDSPAFDLLVTTPPTSVTPVAPIYCDIAGHYDGTLDGSGGILTWSADIDPSTGVIGNATLNGSGSGAGAATRTGTGAQRAHARWTTTSALTSFDASIAADATITGTWTTPLGAGGTASGRRTRPASGCP